MPEPCQKYKLYSKLQSYKIVFFTKKNKTCNLILNLTRFLPVIGTYSVNLAGVDQVQPAVQIRSSC